MTMRAFVYNALPSRVIFGEGTRASILDEAKRLGLSSVLVLSTPQRKGEAERLAQSLGGRSAGTFAGAVMHTPVDVTDKALVVVSERKVDGVVAVGGGSTTGLAKAIA